MEGRSNSQLTAMRIIYPTALLDACEIDKLRNH